MTTRVVLVTGELPHDNPGHAGGVYVKHVFGLAAANAEVTVIAPDSPANRAAASMPGRPERTLISAYPATATPWRRAIEAAAFRGDHAIRSRAVALPSYLILRALLRDSPERRAIRRADVVDLQWAEAIRLAPIIRRINPTARIVGTFHDVPSQVHARLVAADPAARGWRSANAWQLRRAESRALTRLDDVVVFSPKDATLLGGRDGIRVIRPPLAVPGSGGHLVGAEPVVAMVSVLSRPENSEGAEWLLRDIWPLVVQVEPSAQLRLIGGGAPTDLTGLAERTPGVTMTGFVDSLEPEYAAARCVVVPLLRGAGVKFKTIEALVRGVPVATTRVGAEGIDAERFYAVCSDQPAVVARGILTVLADPDAAQARADEAQRWATEVFGCEQFLDEISASYQVTGWSAPPQP